MTINIERSGVHDVSRSNPRDILYIRGNATTDGSIRIMFDPNDPDPIEAHIELLKEDPVSGEFIWNDTGFRFDSSSVSLGRDLRLGAVGGFLETFNVSEIDQHIKALLPHIQFSALGTVTPAHVPTLDKREDFIVFAGPSDGEIIESQKSGEIYYSAR